MSFLGELKRRHVYRIGIAYLVLGWIVIQVTDTVAPALKLPDWTLTVVTWFGVLGFPFALLFAWAFELTPAGIKRTASSERADNPGNTAFSEKSENELAERSIAVLPFVNMSSDPEQEYFSDGISEEILNTFARIPGLQVRGRSSSFYFKGRNEDLRTIGAMLKVGYLVEGSVRKAADQIRITVELLDVRSDTHLWSKTYDRELKAVFAIQEDIARSIAEALEITLRVGKLGRIDGMTQDMRAYEDYLTGRSHFRHQYAHIQEAIEYLERAVGIDPDFGLAWGELADVYSEATLWCAPERANEYRKKSEQAAACASAIAPNASSTLYAMAVLKRDRREWADAETTMRHSLALYPNDYGSNLGYAILLGSVGRMRESLGYVERAGRIEPLNFLPLQSAILYLDALGELDKALLKADEAHQCRIGDPIVIDSARWLIGKATNDRALMAATYEKVIQASERYLPPANHALTPTLYGLLDQPEAGRAALHRFVNDPGYSSDFIRTSALATWACYFGDPELALALQYRDGKPIVARMDHLWRTIYRPMRRLPGFKQLVADIGLVDYWRKTGNWGDFCRPIGDEDFECE